MMRNYSKSADIYCEEHGIIDYIIHGKCLIYYANYPAMGNESRRTYKVMVDLDEMKEISRELMKRWNRRGNHNMCK